MNYKDYFDWASKLIVFAATAFGLYKAYIEFRNAQRWKKAEFLAKEAKDFFSDLNVTRALKFLDYREHDIVVLGSELPNKGTIHFNQDLLLKSWAVDKPIDQFSPEELLIRNIFDEFLTKLSYFNYYLDTNLITLNDLRPYLGYWVNIIGNPQSGKRSNTVLRQIWKFIEYYEYNAVASLVKKFGYNPDFS